MLQFVCWLLIILPFDATRFPLMRELPKAWLPHLAEAAAGLDVADPFWANADPSFAQELAWCRTSYQMTRDCPPSREWQRFPCLAACQQVLEFNAKCQHFLEMQRPDRPEDMTAIQAQLTILMEHRETWRLLRDLHRQDPPCRRLFLKQLQVRLGEGYWTGQVPSTVPLELWTPVP